MISQLVTSPAPGNSAQSSAVQSPRLKANGLLKSGNIVRTNDVFQVRTPVHFGSDGHQSHQPQKDTLGQKFSRAGAALKHDLTSGSWWLKQGLVSGALTLATCWLPGSQLVTIPVWLASSLAIDSMTAFFDKDFVNRQQKEAAEEASSQGAKDLPMTTKAKGAFRGSWDGIKKGITEHFLMKLGISTAVCVATCWLPGSQLILVPAVYGLSSIFEGCKGLLAGWKNPNLYLKPENTSEKAGLEQPGEAQAKQS